MKIINLSSIANPISISVQNPSRSDYDRFIGLEHYDSGEPVITRFQGTELLTTSAKAFKANDILIARRNVYLKRAGIVFFDGITSGDSIILRLKEDTQKTIGYSREDLIRYIPFMLNSEHFWIYANKHADGMNSKRISKDTLLEYEFELPSIDEMRDISDKLWAAYRLKEAYKKLLVTTWKIQCKLPPKTKRFCPLKTFNRYCAKAIEQKRDKKRRRRSHTATKIEKRKGTKNGPESKKRREKKREKAKKLR